MKKVLLYSLILFSSFTFISCDSSEKNEEKDSSDKTENQTTTTTSGDTASKNEAPKSAGTTKITFEETEHNFGKIKHGIPVEHVFKFKNTGTLPLIVNNAKAGCGCTTPEWTREALQPGEEGKISVKYNATGSNEISKTVSVYANTDPEVTELTIRANVEAVPPPVNGPFKK